MLMSEFATAVRYHVPIKVIILNNKILGMIRWEQMAFLGNPEYGIELSQIDFVKIRGLWWERIFNNENQRCRADDP